MINRHILLKFGKLLFIVVSVLPIFIGIKASIAQDSSLPACALNETQLLGQQWVAVGSSGGIQPDFAFAEANGGVMPVGSLAADLMANGSGPVTAATMNKNPDVHVLLLIVDDFAPGAHARAHGDYVLEIATAAYHSVYNGGNIVVDTADIAPDNTADSVVTAIDQAIARNSETRDFQKIVLNMSFVFVPCNIEITVGDQTITANVSEFLDMARSADQVAELQDKDLSLVDYLMIQGGYDPNGEDLRADIQGELVSFIAGSSQEGNPLQDDLTSLINQFGAVNVIPLAASGNFGLDEAFPPGSWDTVISVGGYPADALVPQPAAVSPGDHWLPANNGEIMGPAAWFAVRSGEFVAGTSFAAPMASVLTSLLAIQDTCDFTPWMSASFGNTPYADALAGSC